MIRRGPIFIVLSTNTTIVGPSPNLPFTIFTEIICFQQGILCAIYLWTIKIVPNSRALQGQPPRNKVNYTFDNIDGPDIKKNLESSVMFLRNCVLILNWKENDEASAICFEIRITRKNKESLVLTVWKILVNFPQNVPFCNLLCSQCTFNPVLCQPLTLCSIKFPLCTIKSWQNYVWCTLQSTLFKPFSMQ